MNLLLSALRNREWEDSGMTFNGSKIYIVKYGDDNEQLRFWNDSDSSNIDCDDVCKAIYDLIVDEGLDIQNNTIQDSWNTVAFEIDDNNY